QAALHRLDEVTPFLSRLLDRVGRHERASTDRGVVEHPSLEAIRSHGVDVTSCAQPIPVDNGLGLARRFDRHVRVADRLFRGPDWLTGHMEEAWHLLREA